MVCQGAIFRLPHTIISELYLSALLNTRASFLSDMLVQRRNNLGLSCKALFQPEHDNAITPLERVPSAYPCLTLIGALYTFVDVLAALSKIHYLLSSTALSVAWHVRIHSEAHNVMSESFELSFLDGIFWS